MDTEKIKALLLALELGNLSAAAKRLGYTPSGMSRIVTSLEEDMGFPLIVRSRTGIQPTRDCLELLPTMREFTRLGNQMEDMASDIRGTLSGNVTIGTAYPSYYKMLSEIIREFSLVYPNIRIEIHESYSTKLSKEVEDGISDFCIISRRPGNFDWISLPMDRMLLWVPSSSLYAKEKSLDISLVEEEPYIDINHGYITDGQMLFQKYHVHPNTKFETQDVYSTFVMVGAGLGVSMANALYDGVWEGPVTSVEITQDTDIENGIAVPSKDRISPSAKAFRDFALAYIEKHGIIR